LGLSDLNLPLRSTLIYTLNWSLETSANSIYHQAQLSSFDKNNIYDLFKQNITHTQR